MHNSILPQIDPQVNKHFNNRNEVLTLADFVLDQARLFRAEFLARGPDCLPAGAGAVDPGGG